MDLKSSYLGIPAQCALGLIAFVPHQYIKYHTVNCIRVIRSDPKSILQQIMQTRKDKQKMKIALMDEHVTCDNSVEVKTRSYEIDMTPSPVMLVGKEYDPELRSLRKRHK